jgi:hypothetical protein
MLFMIRFRHDPVLDFGSRGCRFGRSGRRGLLYAGMDEDGLGKYPEGVYLNGREGIVKFRREG